MGRDMYKTNRRDTFRQWTLLCAEAGASLRPQLSICLLKPTEIELQSFEKKVGDKYLHPIHRVALWRPDYVYATLTMLSATDCETVSLLISVKLSLLSLDVRFCSCSDIRVRAIVK